MAPTRVRGLERVDPPTRSLTSTYGAVPPPSRILMQPSAANAPENHNSPNLDEGSDRPDVLRDHSWLVGRGGFEPPKAMPADLQSAPFGHSGTDPGTEHASASPAGPTTRESARGKDRAHQARSSDGGGSPPRAPPPSRPVSAARRAAASGSPASSAGTAAGTTRGMSGRSDPPL